MHQFEGETCTDYKLKALSKNEKNTRHSGQKASETDHKLKNKVLTTAQHR